MNTKNTPMDIKKMFLQRVAKRMAINLLIGLLLVAIIFAGLFSPEAWRIPIIVLAVVLCVVAATIAAIKATKIASKLIGDNLSLEDIDKFMPKGFENPLRKKEILNGLPATATVLRSYQGNMKVTFGGVQENFKMIIEVDIKNTNGETWQAKMEEMIPINQIGIFQPGATFNVLYDPNDRSSLIFDTSPQTNPSRNVPGYGTVDQQTVKSAMQSAPQDITLRLQAANALLQEMKLTGIAASATVISSELMYENYMNGIDVYQIRLKINAAEIPPFEGETLGLILKTSVHKIAPNKTVYVKYDRNNPHRFSMTGTDKPDNTAQL